MNRAIGVFLVLVLGVVLVGCGGADSTGKKKATTPQGGDSSAKESTAAPAPSGPDLMQAKPDVVIAAADLAKQMDADINGTKKKYAGKVLEVSGVVVDPFAHTPFVDSSIAISHSTEGSAGMGTNLVLCVPDSRHPVDREALWRDQTITVRGECFDSGPLISLRNCVFPKIGEPMPSLTVTAKQLIDEATKDREAFGQKYRQKTLVVEGFVAATGQGGAGPWVRIKGEKGGVAGPTLVHINYQATSQKSAFEKLAVDQPIKVKGKCLAVAGESSTIKGHIELIYVMLLK